MTELQSALKNSKISKKKMVIVDDSDVKMIQQVLLETLDDILDVCNKYNIQYQMSGGSTLGAVRHQGFIPWDDDLDINMPRSEVNRFLKQFRRLYGNKYWIHVPGETKDYDYMMIKIINKSIRERGLMDSEKKECGIFVDIFIVENTFNNGLLRRIHGYGCMAFRYALSCIRFQRESEELRNLFAGDETLSKYLKTRSFIGRILLLIPLNWWTKMASAWTQLCKNNQSKYVVITAGTHQFFQELYVRKLFNKSLNAKFEGRTVKITKDYDNYLSKLYGDYMTIPPVEKREQHVMLELDREALSKYVEKLKSEHAST